MMKVSATKTLLVTTLCTVLLIASWATLVYGEEKQSTSVGDPQKKKEEDKVTKFTCRLLTKEYLDREINGKEGGELEVKVRVAREHWTEVKQSSLHPEGTADSDTPENAEKALQEAVKAQNKFHEATVKEFASRLLSTCRTEAQEAGKYDIEEKMYLVTQTALGTVDSLVGSWGAPTQSAYSELESQLTMAFRKIFRNVFLAQGFTPPTTTKEPPKPTEPSGRPVAAASWEDSFVYYLKAACFTCGVLCTMAFIYFVVTFVFPVLLFYTVGYQYCWLVWAKCIFIENILRREVLSNPGVPVENLLVGLVAGAASDHATIAFFFAFFFLLCCFAALLVMPWLVRIFFGPNTGAANATPRKKQKKEQHNV